MDGQDAEPFVQARYPKELQRDARPAKYKIAGLTEVLSLPYNSGICNTQ